MERTRRNVAALKALRRLEDSGERPTAKDDAALAAYSGWGGAQEAFSKSPDTESWREVRKDLADLLPGERYAAARASTITAFYTPRPVVEALWDQLRLAGVGTRRQAKVLEPGCGTGNFMRAVPADLDVAMTGVEVDPTSAAIAQALARPQDTVINAALEDCSVADGSFDAVIGNVPYSDSIRIDEDGRSVPIHDYFISKSLDAVKPGGVAALLTSRYTLDKMNGQSREELAKRAELVGMARLPEETFTAQAGTSVISDVLVLRRRPEALAEVPGDASEWMAVEALPGLNGAEGPKVNRAVADHPERVVGRLGVGTGPWGPTLTVREPGITPAAIGEGLKASLFAQVGPRAQEIRQGAQKAAVAAEVTVRPSSVEAFELTVAADGGVWYGDGGTVVPFEPRSAKDLPRVRAMLHLRDESRALLALEADPAAADDAVEAKIRELDARYDAFVDQYGHLADAANGRALRQNQFQDASVATTLLSLEETSRGRFAAKAPMLTRRVVTPVPAVPDHVESAADAVAISIDRTAGLDEDLVAHLLDLPKEALDDALGDLAVRDPDTGELLLADEYLSGDVKTKLAHVKSLIDEAGHSPERSALASWHDELGLPDHLTQNAEARLAVSQGVRALSADGFYQRVFTPVSASFVGPVDDSDEWRLAREVADAGRVRHFGYLVDRLLSDAERDPSGGVRGYEAVESALVNALRESYDAEAWSPNQDTADRPSWALWRAAGAVSQSPDQLGRLVNGALVLAGSTPCVEALSRALGHKLDRQWHAADETHKDMWRDNGAFIEALKAHPGATEYVFGLEGQGRLSEASPEGLAFFEEGRSAALDAAAAVDEARLSTLRDLEDRLDAVQPALIESKDIAVQLGSAWLPPSMVMGFMAETFGMRTLSMSDGERRSWSVAHDPESGRWQVRGTGRSLPGSAARKYGIDQYPCFKLVESLLNGSQLRCTKPDPNDPDGKRRVPDPVATARAWEKRTLIEKAFSEWVWTDEDRAATLEAIYNERFNRVRTRHYDGSALTFPGTAEVIHLRKHQADAVARVLQSEEGTLLGHVVGAGKTFEAVAAMHEAKRLGRATKPMAVVPNHLTGQFASEWLRMYPDAKLLVMNDADTRSPEAAQRFWGRARAGSWDAVVVGRSRFSKLELSPEIREEATRERIEELEASLRAERAASGKKSFTVKAQEAMKKSLESTLKRLQEKNGGAERGISFDELGVDMLVVDESHYFKNLGVAGAQVAGMGVTASGKCEDLLYKCDWLREQGKGRNIVFMTGTPVTNTMGELYNLQRYLSPKSLAMTGTKSFSDWALTYGHLEETMEVRPEGGGFQSKMRFTRFQNLPELMVAYHGFADIVTADMVDLDLPRCVKRTVAVEPTPEQKEAMDLLVERAKLIRAGAVDPKADNMLKITGDGRKLALDPMLVPELGAERPLAAGKVQACADEVFRIWSEGKGAKGTQLVFCDASTDANTHSPYNVYDDLRRRLHDLGIPDAEVASVGDVGSSKEKREELFEAVDRGEVRVLVGSTETLGTGTNVQRRLQAIHDLDCPWRPSDLEQRLGRIVRQGNENGLVHDLRYVTKGTFDAYMYQTVERKQRFIAQTFTSKSPARVVDDLDQVQLDYAEVKALATGDPDVAKVLGLENDVRQLDLARRAWQEGKSEVKASIEGRLAPTAALLQQRFDLLSRDQAAFAAAAGVAAPEGDAAKEQVARLLGAPGVGERSVIGRYRGLDVVRVMRPAARLGDPPMRYVGLLPHGESDLASAHMAKGPMALAQAGPYTVARQLDALIETDAKGPELVADDLSRAKADLADAQAMAEAPWDQEAEWREKSTALAALRDGIGAEARAKGREEEAGEGARRGQEGKTAIGAPEDPKEEEGEAMAMEPERLGRSAVSDACVAREIGGTFCSFEWDGERLVFDVGQGRRATFPHVKDPKDIAGSVWDSWLDANPSGSAFKAKVDSAVREALEKGGMELDGAKPCAADVMASVRGARAQRADGEGKAQARGPKRAQ